MCLLGEETKKKGGEETAAASRAQGSKSVLRPSPSSFSSTSVSSDGFTFLKRDGRFRICTSLRNCSPRGFCRGQKGLVMTTLRRVASTPFAALFKQTPGAQDRRKRARFPRGITYPNATRDEALEMILPALICHLLQCWVQQLGIELLQGVLLDVRDLLHHGLQLGVARALWGMAGMGAMQLGAVCSSAPTQVPRVWDLSSPPASQQRAASHQGLVDLEGQVDECGHAAVVLPVRLQALQHAGEEPGHGVGQQVP